MAENRYFFRGVVRDYADPDSIFGRILTCVAGAEKGMTAREIRAVFRAPCLWAARGEKDSGSPMLSLNTALQFALIVLNLDWCLAALTASLGWGGRPPPMEVLRGGVTAGTEPPGRARREPETAAAAERHRGDRGQVGLDVGVRPDRIVALGVQVEQDEVGAEARGQPAQLGAEPEHPRGLGALGGGGHGSGVP